MQTPLRPCSILRLFHGIHQARPVVPTPLWTRSYAPPPKQEPIIGPIITGRESRRARRRKRRKLAKQERAAAQAGSSLTFQTERSGNPGDNSAIAVLLNEFAAKEPSREESSTPFSFPFRLDSVRTALEKRTRSGDVHANANGGRVFSSTANREQGKDYTQNSTGTRTIPTDPLTLPPFTSVSLQLLPPFTTLSDLSRIALRAGARPHEIIGVQLWLKKKRSNGSGASGDNDAEGVALAQNGNVQEEGSRTDDIPWRLGGTIHFRDAQTARAFKTVPLLLEVLPPVSHPQVRVYPPAKHSSALRATRLWPLAKVTGIWTAKVARALRALKTDRIEDEDITPTHDPEAERQPNKETLAEGLRGKQLEASTPKAGGGGESDAVLSAESEPKDAPEDPNRERARALEFVWNVVAGPDGSFPSGKRPEWEDSPGASTGSSSAAVDQATDQARSPDMGSMLAKPTGTLVHVPLTYSRHPYYTDELLERLNADGAGRWLGFRVPGTVPAFPPAPLTREASELDPTVSPDPEEEHSDPAVRLYATSLRKSLARERELEAALRRMRDDDQTRSLEAARLAAVAQVHTDFGAFGALEGVWVRSVHVQAAKPESAGYEVQFHALVAFADAQGATRAKTLVPVQQPTYADAGLHFVRNPWPAALAERNPDADAGSDAVGAEEVVDGGSAQEEWAHRLAREHHAETLAREREAERERQRGVAEGTWGKELLSEVKERLMRKRHSEQRHLRGSNPEASASRKEFERRFDHDASEPQQLSVVNQSQPPLTVTTLSNEDVYPKPDSALATSNEGSDTTHVSDSESAASSDSESASSDSESTEEHSDSQVSSSDSKDSSEYSDSESEESNSSESASESDSEEEELPSPFKRGRGRPPKNP